nr:DegT/DnrJ/EryC1/StrS aminotransferase family protein [Bacteroidota bacterium]
GFNMLYRPSFYWPIRDLFHKLGSIGVAESNYNPVQENRVAEDFSLRMPKPLQRRLEKKLSNLDRLTTRSQWISNQYRSGIKSNTVKHPVIPSECVTVFARYPLLVNDKGMLLKLAREANVELADWYNTPIHPLSEQDWTTVYYIKGSCPIAETRCKQVVTLPVHPTVKKKDVNNAILFLNKLNYLL